MQNYKAKIYEYYFTNRTGRVAPATLSGLASRSPFYQHVIDTHFPADKTATIVDLGSGYGAFLYFMHQSGYENAQGIDASAEMVDVSRELGIQGVTQGDVAHFLEEQPSDSIDVLTAIDLIEHIPKEELFALVAQFHRVLKKGGRVVCHQPNAEGLFGNAILYGDFTHEQAFTRVSMAQIFLSNEFDSIVSFEDKPLKYSAKSRARRILWNLLVRPFYLFLIAVESGGSDKEIILTKNFLSVAIK
jgi:2-polyprenyl-3-methyl-5-hydroxy-6-metoxy-1,4-benzoquinol methylase